MADDAFILQQAVDVAPGEAGDPVEIEIVEGGAEILPLCEDRAPAQPGLKSLEAQLLEQATVVADRKAPFAVVIMRKIRCRTGPAASHIAVRPDDRRAHLPGLVDSGRGVMARIPIHSSRSVKRCRQMALEQATKRLHVTSIWPCVPGTFEGNDHG